MEELKKLIEQSGLETNETALCFLRKQLPKMMIPKSEFNSKLKEIKKLKQEAQLIRQQLAERNRTIRQLDCIRKRLLDQRTRYENFMVSLRMMLEKMDFEAALEKELWRRGAKSVRAVSSLIDNNRDWQKISEQLDSITLEAGYLFDTELRTGGDIE